MYESDDPPEPTIEDYCSMDGHEPTDWIDPESGLNVCQCGMPDYPVEMEPHDEYSAYRTELIDAYVGNLVRRCRRDQHFEARLPYRKIRREIGIALRYSTPGQIMALKSSLDATPSELITEDLIRELMVGEAPFRQQYTTAHGQFLRIGIHFGPEDARTASRVLGLERPSEYIYGTYASVADLPDERMQEYRLLVLLNARRLVPRNYLAKTEGEGALGVVLPFLLEHPEKLDAVSALLNSRGSSPKTARCIIQMLSETGPVVPDIFIDGKL